MQLLLPLLLIAALPTVELRTLEGENVVGELEACDAEVVRIKGAEGSREFSAEEVWEIAPVESAGAAKNPDAKLAVELTDGTLLWATDFRVENGDARVKLGNGETVSASTASVVSVKFDVPTDLEAQWQEILKKKVAGDLVVVQRDGALDYLEGVLGDTDQDGAFQFSLDGDTLPVKRKRLAGISYFHKAAGEAPTSVAAVTDAAGNRYSAAELQFADGKVSGKTAAGASWSVPLEALAKIDFSQGRVAFLSDLAPVRQEWTPYVGGVKLPRSVAAFYALKSNRGFEAQDLRLAGQRYTKGLALHSRTEAVYRLDGQYRRFQALAGIDDRTEGLGAVRLVIRGDDRQLWEGEIAAGDAPVLLNLATDNVRALSILVDYGAGQDTADHLNLCDAKVIR